MKNTPLTVDVSPEMTLYKVLQSQSYDEEAAMSEFIDNSIQSFVDNRDAILEKDPSQDFTINIDIDTKSKTVIIEDNAGGIHRNDLQRAITMGRDPNDPHRKNSLSVYGMGLKSSAIWFSSQWQLETSCIDSDEKLSFVFDLDNLLASNSSEVTVNVEREDASRHYTKVTLLNNFRRDDQEFYQNIVLPFLLETFFKFKNIKINVSHNKVDLFANEKKLFISPKPPLNAQKFNSSGEIENIASKAITWEKNIDFTIGEKPVYGFIRIMNPGSQKQPGIRLLRNNRVIQGTSVKRNLPENITGTANKYRSQRVYGEIHLDQFSVNYQKTGFNEDLNGVYSKIREVLIDGNNLIKQAENYRSRKSKKPKDSNDQTEGGVTDSNNDSSQASGDNDSHSNRAKTTSKIKKSESLLKALGRTNNYKLPKLYDSLCVVSLKEHPVLMYVGAWTFLESLAALMGNPNGNDFKGYLKSKAKVYCGRNKGQKNDIQSVISEIHTKGNSIKHSGNRTSVNGEQLHNDFEVLEEFLIHCLNEL